jgi:hypothetical protein
MPRSRLVLAFVLLLPACDDAVTEPGLADVPCGKRLCSADDTDDPSDDAWTDGLGKADAAAVATALDRAVADGTLDADDVRELFDAAGGRVSGSEMLAIRDAVESTAFEVTDEAKTTALTLATQANLFDHELEDVVDGESFGGAKIPAAVQELVAKARLSGAVAFDVNEVDEDDGEGVWSPYPSTTPAVDNMSFEHTEITPESLKADLADTQVTYNRIVGTETAEECDGSGNCSEYRRAKLVPDQGGTGHVLAHYDEVFHEDIWARGSSGQKWANNCAILSDGSLHCLPATRRSVIQDLILTNPHLSRCNPYAGFETDCKHMLYHGHIDVRDGVVVGVEMSGRLSKRAAEGKANFIDPLAVLEAWGFQIAPNVTIRYGNTSEGVPTRDLEHGIVTVAAP